MKPNNGSADTMLLGFVPQHQPTMRSIFIFDSLIVCSIEAPYISAPLISYVLLSLMPESGIVVHEQIEFC